MKLHRFIGDFDLKKNKILIADGDFLNQVRNVLRLKAGDRIILSDGRGAEAEGILEEIGKDGAVFRLSNHSENFNEPARKAVLYCALIKRENFEWVAQKATEVGVSKIVPVISERTVKLNLKRDRLLKIIKEAAEQSGRGIVPVLSEPINFGEALIAAVKNNDLNLIFVPQAPIIVSGMNFKKENKIGIFIGPEGGWTEKELEESHKVGLKSVSLGNLTLRSETAAVVASHIIINA
ncbi:16S rRNA (uracil(1498)-N(3))-methyltransferase [bacterium]|nr:MAG: 16S rRNA (uracil(1498)-N(3))-methyltransferase [bacterium]